MAYPLGLPDDHWYVRLGEMTDEPDEPVRAKPQTFKRLRLRSAETAAVEKDSPHGDEAVNEI